MQKYNRPSPRKTTYGIIMLVLCILLSACSKKATPTLDAVLLATLTPDPKAVQETPAPQNSPSPTVTLLPPSQMDSSSSKAGLIIFSMSDGKYKHLFAYHPSYLPVTRITSDEWDDDSPAISPDGNQIAFTSNRFGNRDVYVLNLATNTLTQMTNSIAYEGSICWSIDGNYIAYDVYQNGFYDLIIQSVTDRSEAPIQLTDGTSNNFQPAWSPDGSQLAFVTDRSGRNEIWLARLQNPEDRFIKIIGSTDADYSHPVWSADGSMLAVDRDQNGKEILVFQTSDFSIEPLVLGNGSNPVWLPDGSGILGTLDMPNQTEILAYAINDRHLMLPPIPLPGSVSGYDWRGGAISDNILRYLSVNTISQPSALWSDQTTGEVDESGRRSLVPLEGVTAPQASLSDAVDDSFTQLRALVNEKAGWDFLDTLENATLAPTDESLPDILENWLYTGRAIALNMAPYEAQWMVATREDFAGEVYWRIWIKCKLQDGSCGKPLETPVWDFNSRFSGEPMAYENGGEFVQAPAGYWIDFTELALRFGWERLPSQNNWRSYFPGILFNTFVMREGYSWQQALLDIYPVDQAALIIEKSQ